MSQTGDLSFANQEADDKTLFGFWVYLMTDCVLFGSIFATYAVLHNNTYGGPSGGDLFYLPTVLAETIILLTSSFTCGMAVLAARMNRHRQLLAWLVATFILGLCFLALELNEFHGLVVEGNSWTRSGFLTSFFTLVGTHGLHITIGLVWMATMMVKIWKTGLKPAGLRQLTMLGLFWHFLDVIWIFILSIVYLFGALNV